MDRGAWQVIVHRLAKSPTGLSDWYYRKQSTAQKTITPATKTWDYLKRVLLFPGGSLSESCSAVSDQSLSGSSVHGIPQARILQWVTIPFSRRTFARNWAWVYHTESRLSHQGNSNQPKKKKKKKKNLSANIRGPGSVLGEQKIWLVYLLSHVQSAILSSLEKPHCGFMDIGLPLCLSWERIRLQCGRPGLHPWVGKIPAKGEG